MAIWQYEVHLAPRGERSPSPGPGEGDTPTGGELRLTCTFADIARWLDERFPRTPAWSDDVITWGEENGHRVRAVLQDRRLVELNARVDLRQSCTQFVKQLLALADMTGTEWMTGDDERIDPSLQAFREAILRSPSYRFVTDPHRFLSEIGEQSGASP